MYCTESEAEPLQSIYVGPETVYYITKIFTSLVFHVTKTTQEQILSSCYYMYKQLPQKDILNVLS